MVCSQPGPSGLCSSVMVEEESDDTDSLWVGRKRGFDTSSGGEEEHAKSWKVLRKKLPKKSSPVITISDSEDEHTPKKDLEKYRKMKWCPVPGCLSKPQKKLSNHIVRTHPHIGADERAILLKKAKVATSSTPKSAVIAKQLTITKAFQMALKPPAPSPDASPKVIVPTYKDRPGKTHHYPRFCSKSNPILASFASYLQTADGGRKGDAEAKQITEDVSMYLYFADKSHVNISSATDPAKMNNYTTKLLDEGVGIEGVMTKLDRLSIFLDYLVLNDELETQAAEKMKMRLKKWRQGLRKERKGLEADRLDRFIENPPDILPIRRLLTRSDILEHFITAGKRAKKGQLLTPSTINEFGAYLYAIFVHINGQRPGSVANITVTDVQNATTLKMGGEHKLVIRCSSHKTAHSYGAAKLSLDEKFMDVFRMYEKYVRPKIETDVENFIVTATGKAFKNHAYYLQQLCDRHQAGKLPTATATRKVVASAQVGREKQALLAKHMCHSQDVHDRYYQATHSVQRAAQASTIICGIIQGS